MKQTRRTRNMMGYSRYTTPRWAPGRPDPNLLLSQAKRTDDIRTMARIQEIAHDWNLYRVTDYIDDWMADRGIDQEQMEFHWPKYGKKLRYARRRKMAGPRLVTKKPKPYQFPEGIRGDVGGFNPSPKFSHDYALAFAERAGLEFGRAFGEEPRAGGYPTSAFIRKEYEGWKRYGWRPEVALVMSNLTPAQDKELFAAYTKGFRQGYGTRHLHRVKNVSIRKIKKILKKPGLRGMTYRWSSKMGPGAYFKRKSAATAAAKRERSKNPRTHIYRVQIPPYDMTISAKSKPTALREAHRWCAQRYRERTGRPMSEYRLPRGIRITETTRPNPEWSYGPWGALGTRTMSYREELAKRRERAKSKRGMPGPGLPKRSAGQQLIYLDQLAQAEYGIAYRSLEPYQRERIKDIAASEAPLEVPNRNTKRPSSEYWRIHTGKKDWYIYNKKTGEVIGGPYETKDQARSEAFDLPRGSFVIERERSSNPGDRRHVRGTSPRRRTNVSRRQHPRRRSARRSYSRR